jgi:hypothetical protein
MPHTFLVIVTLGIGVFLVTAAAIALGGYYLWPSASQDFDDWENWRT